MFMSAPEETQLAQMCVAPDYDVIEKQTYAFDQERAGTPYDWEFDLCAITLGNFNYRKMSLVRDYNAVLQEDLPSPSFDGIFAWAWSGSEKILLDFFLGIFYGGDKCPGREHDLMSALSRWPPATNEGEVISSWFDAPFWF